MNREKPKKSTASLSPQSPTPGPAPSGVPQIVLRPGEDRRVRRGHLWIFSNEVAQAPADLAPGAAVQFLTARGDLLGVGFYNSRSLIAGRLLDREARDLDAAFFERRLRAALDVRRPVFSDDAYRWVFGESDDMPGLVIDRYGDVAVLESYCAGMDRLLPAVVAAIKAIHPWKALVLRNDAQARKLEGLEERVEVLEGQADAPHWFVTDGIKVAADLLKGQKTGFFFDQRVNRRAAAELAPGKRVLDLFCHTGGFGLWAAKAGAARVTGVDASAPALELARAAARENGFQDRMEFVEMDAFDWLSRSQEKFDLVVADPPRFAAGKKQAPKALEAYVRLNALALRRVSGGGFLATASCSQHVDRDTFRQILSRASYESGRKVRILRWGTHSPDHPVRPSMPETDYLKFAVLHVA